MSEAPELPDLPEPHDKRLNRAVAATVVVLSVVMALSNIKDGNIVQTMQAAQAAQIDSWNEYQATRLKLHMEEIAVAQAGERGADAARSAAAVRKYAGESGTLKAQALAAKGDYDTAGYRDDQFDLADGLASIALATTAIAALAETWWAAVLRLGRGRAVDPVQRRRLRRTADPSRPDHRFPYLIAARSAFAFAICSSVIAPCDKGWTCLRLIDLKSG